MKSQNRVTTGGQNRRQFLKTTLQTGALLLAPQIVPGAVLGKDGGVAPSERIVLGAIGIGGRGSYVLGCFMEEPDVRFVAICDIKAERRIPGLAGVDAQPDHATPGPVQHRDRAAAADPLDQPDVLGPAAGRVGEENQVPRGGAGAAQRALRPGQGLERTHVGGAGREPQPRLMVGGADRIPHNGCRPRKRRRV